MAGAKLARTVRFSRTTRVGGTYVSVRLPTKTIMELRTLEQGQKDIFRAELIQRFDSEIQALIES